MPSYGKGKPVKKQAPFGKEKAPLPGQKKKRATKVPKVSKPGKRG